MPSNVVTSFTSFLAVSLISTMAAAGSPVSDQCDKSAVSGNPQKMTLQPVSERLFAPALNASEFHNSIAQRYSRDLPWKHTSAIASVASRAQHLAAAISESTARSTQVSDIEQTSHVAAYHAHRADALIAQANEEKLFLQTAAVSDTTLDASRGAFAAEQLGVAILESTAINNVTQGGITGDNFITDNAFSSSSGIITLIQNSGNNVSIQQATIVNLSLE